MLRRSYRAVDPNGQWVLVFETLLPERRDTEDGPVEILGLSSWTDQAGRKLIYCGDGRLMSEDGTEFKVQVSKLRIDFDAATTGQ